MFPLISKALDTSVASQLYLGFSRCLSIAPQLADFNVKNEKMYDYLKGSSERKELEKSLEKLQATCEDIPIVVGGEEIRTGEPRYHVMPFDHQKKVAKFYWATPDIVEKAIKKAMEARESWEAVPLTQRIKILLKAADLVSQKYRMDLNAATMLGQAKTVFQAEIDSAAELADFFRYNAYFAKELTKYQPLSTDPSVTKNFFRLRGIEGFIAAVSPFNFTAIGGNLATAPALMGNVVLWKPSDTAILSNYTIFKILREAGFPDGVINFIPADGPVFGDTICASPHLAGINFTGSVPTFRHLWKITAQKLDKYKNFPRLVGECGGKNFHFVHASADVDNAVNNTIRGAFEYSGQKCSATSRLYVAESIWPKIKEGLAEAHKKIKVGSPLEYDTFFSAVIDDKAFTRISSYLKHAKSGSNLKILAGGNCDNSRGYFVDPTIVETKDPKDRIMVEEIFGPVLTVYVYPDKDTNAALELARDSVPFALTGAIFGQDEAFLSSATETLKMAAGNFYINDKSTGAVVGQQPFGGGRVSGTNDKAGGPHYLLRWTSPQTIKQTFTPIKDWTYAYMKS